MKNFTTIFPSAENVHLIKDVGQLANTIAATGEYEAKLVCFKNSSSYSFLNTEAKSLKVDFIIPCGKKLFMEKAVLNYIKKNASQIDVMHFFHLTKETIYYALYYKKYNPSGQVYVKMDVNNEMLQQEINYSKKGIFNWIHKRKESQFFKKLSVISTENPTALNLLENKFPILTNKALLIPNGVNNTFLNEQFPQIKEFEEKENIILSVGRIGASDKNFEMLLKAFSNANLKDWKLIFAGPIENKFDEKVAKVIAEKPELKDNIELLGNIDDRKKLYDYYNRSKICCLSSPFESFGITFVEAMYFGNYVIGTTGMSSFSYITNDFQLGAVVDADDENALTKMLEQKTKDESMLTDNYFKAQNQIKEKFYWSKIVVSLMEKLNKSAV